MRAGAGRALAARPGRRPRQPQVLAQRAALVLGAKQPAPLQDRHHFVDEVLQPARQHVGHEIEAIGRAGAEPALDIVGDLLGRAHDLAMPAAAGQLAQQFAQRVAVLPRARQDGAKEGVVAVGRQRQVFRQRPVELEPLRRDAEPACQPPQTVLGRDQVDQLAMPALRLGLGAADEGAQAGEDPDRVRAAALRLGGVPEALRVVERLLERSRGREYRLGMPRGQRAAVVRATGLHQHRMALRRARLVQHAVHREELAPMLDRAQLVEVDETPAGGIGQQGVIAPAIPQRLDDLSELGRAAVARGVVGHRVEAVVARRLQVGGGDDVPARAPAAHQVQRGEAARQVVGFVVAGGGGGDQA